MTDAAAPLPDPEEYACDADPVLVQTPPSTDNNGDPWPWTPMWHRPCTFGPDAFDAVMQNLVRNPNVLSSWLFRADMVAETTAAASRQAGAPALPLFEGFVRADDRTLVRRLVPRNTLRDEPMLQTCLFYESASRRECHAGHAGPNEEDPDRAAWDDDPVEQSLVVYLPHAASPAGIPFYHPKVQGVGFLHAWRPLAGRGTVSLHFSFFAPAADPVDASLAGKLSRPVLSRVALRLIHTVCKHGEGQRAGYVKRVHHDQLVPQARVQDRYTVLKEKYARRLVQSWQETTDPAKHVFEDLSIAAFLMELWADMYGPGPGSTRDGAGAGPFPGFVDVGCGNGLLVHILNEEGYPGWGLDARARRSWEQYGNGPTRAADAADAAAAAAWPLRQSLLLPFFLRGETEETDATGERDGSPLLHDGRFPPGTFLVANHADELTVWTPLLAALAGCPFLAIPCCSHNFTGARFRAPPPSAAAKEATASVSVTLASSSTYASFVEWVARVAEDCGWVVEREMLRIPSTRNAALVGRTRRDDAPALTADQARAVIHKYGGAHGFADNVAKLLAEGRTSSH